MGMNSLKKTRGFFLEGVVSVKYAIADISVNGQELKLNGRRRMDTRNRYPFAASQSGLYQQIVLLRSQMGLGFDIVENFVGMIPGRKLEADVAIPKWKIAAEYQGGDFMAKSGHTNVKGLARDRFKVNEGQLNGWLIFSFGPDETRSGEAMNVIERAIQARLAVKVPQ